MISSEEVIRAVPTEEKILRSSRRVRVFAAVNCISVLSKLKYKSDDIKKMLQMRRCVAYAKYPILAFIGFLIVAGISRLVVYGITMFTHPPGLWLLSNLFTDCGFFESFIQIYCWGNEDRSHKKNRKN